MAELLLKVGTVGLDPLWQDGDVIQATNSRCILWTHAQMICHVRAAQRGSGGLLLPGTTCHDMHEACCEYRFNRVSETEVKRTLLETGDEETLGPTTNAKGEHIDVPLYLHRRRRRSDHKIFGTDGSEFWYGGIVFQSQAVVDQVWNAIETKTPLRKDDHNLFPLGTQDVKSHLAIEIDEFTDEEAEAFAESDYDEDQSLSRKRQSQVMWQSDLGLRGVDIDAILDRNTPTDFRGVARHPKTIVRTKQAIVNLAPIR